MFCPMGGHAETPTSCIIRLEPVIDLGADVATLSIKMFLPEARPTAPFSWLITGLTSDEGNVISNLTFGRERMLVLHQYSSQLECPSG